MELKESIKRDKREDYNALAAQGLQQNGNKKDLYDTTGKLAGKIVQTNNLVKDEEGNILTKKDEQLKRWAAFQRASKSTSTSKILHQS